MNYNIGVRISKSNVEAAIMQDNLKILETVTQDLVLPVTGIQVENLIEELIKELLKKTNIKKEKINSIGISCPGLIDTENKIVRVWYGFDWKNVSLGDNLEKNLKIPVFIANDTDTTALGEFAYNKLEKGTELLAVIINSGVGAGLIIKDKLFYGYNSSALEAGEMVIEKNGRKCDCGGRGCLQKYVSYAGVVETAKEVMKKYEDSVLWEILKEKKELTCEDVFNASKKEDPAAVEAVDIFLSDLSTGLCNLTNILNPEIIILGGSLSRKINIEQYIETIYKKVNSNGIIKDLDEKCEIRASKIFEKAEIIGAANLYKFV